MDLGVINLKFKKNIFVSYTIVEDISLSVPLLEHGFFVQAREAMTCTKPLMSRWFPVGSCFPNHRSLEKEMFS